MTGFARFAAWVMGGAVVGLLIGFGIAYLIWTFDGRPYEVDTWSLVAGLAVGLATVLGAGVGAYAEGR